MPLALYFTGTRNIGKVSETSEAVFSLMPGSTPTYAYSGEILQT